MTSTAECQAVRNLSRTVIASTSTMSLPRRDGHLLQRLIYVGMTARSQNRGITWHHDRAQPVFDGQDTDDSVNVANTFPHKGTRITTDTCQYGKFFRCPITVDLQNGSLSLSAAEGYETPDLRRAMRRGISPSATYGIIGPSLQVERHGS